MTMLQPGWFEYRGSILDSGVSRNFCLLHHIQSGTGTNPAPHQYAFSLGVEWLGHEDNTPLHLWLKVGLQADTPLLPYEPLRQSAQLRKVTNIALYHHQYLHYS